VAGTIALVGGAEWQPGCDFDAALLAEAGGEVLILPTAAAYEHPDRAVATAEQWFASLGGRARGLMVLGRADAELEANAAAVRSSPFVYLGGGSPLHLRSVLKQSLVWDALLDAWHGGATVAGSSAGAMVLTDPMVDPRGGAFTLGLGLVEQLAVVPHAAASSHEKVDRTLALAPAGVPVARMEERTALLRDAEGHWRVAGAGTVTVFVDHKERDLSVLPG
jgi:cyanophycinase